METVVEREDEEYVRNHERKARKIGRQSFRSICAAHHRIPLPQPATSEVGPERLRFGSLIIETMLPPEPENCLVWLRALQLGSRWSLIAVITSATRFERCINGIRKTSSSYQRHQCISETSAYEEKFKSRVGLWNSGVHHDQLWARHGRSLEVVSSRDICSIHSFV